MTQPDARPTAVAPGDTGARPTPAVDLTSDGVRSRQLRSPGFPSVRRWILGAVLVLVVTLVASSGFLLAQRGGGSEATVGGSSQDARARVASDSPAAANGSNEHRRVPIRRTSPHAS
jgi:hypothetical protein